ncbi:MAG: hypothetical protein L3J08_07895 [Flavobacteriaceae bacterium]|nr:hypothetical protein [Flavobacteriaceae bacterium]
MKIKYVLLISLLIIIFSCGRTTSKKELQTVKDTILPTKDKVIYNEIKLHSKAKKVVENWKEYQKIDEFIRQYYNISSTDALFHANELSQLARQLKDSIRVDKFIIPSIKIRLNVLHNETLRLTDMAIINNISELEVQKENKEILDAYFALNAKINNIINKEVLNSEVNKFIDEVISSPNLNLLMKDTITSNDSIYK